MSHIQPNTHLPKTRTYKTWIAYMSQTGTNAPTVDNLLYNNLGQDIIWTRTTQGSYKGTGNGETIMNSNNTVVTISNGSAAFINGNWNSTNAIYLDTALGVAGSETYEDNVMNDIIVEIRVYNID